MSQVSISKNNDVNSSDILSTEESIIDQDYEIKEMIGSGLSSKIYLATRGEH